MSARNVIALQTHPGGVGAAIRSELYQGRADLVTTGPNAEFGFIGSDPYRTDGYTGLVVPAIPSGQIGGARYLFLLARASFGVGEQSPAQRGVRLVGIRQYAELVARIPGRTGPLDDNAGPAADTTVTFRREITSPLWHPFDGNISWHVMVLNNTERDRRNPANGPGFMFEDARSPALLYQTAAPYTPPNGGRPYGRAIGASLGTIHDMRYRWRAGNSEYVLDIPVPVPCDVALFASVRQNDPTLNPRLSDPLVTQQFSALSPEDQFTVAYAQYAQYGTIAGSLVFEDNLGKEVP